MKNHMKSHERKIKTTPLYYQYYVPDFSLIRKFRKSWHLENWLRKKNKTSIFKLFELLNHTIGHLCSILIVSSRWSVEPSWEIALLINWVKIIVEKISDIFHAITRKRDKNYQNRRHFWFISSNTQGFILLKYGLLIFIIHVLRRSYYRN